MSTFAYPEAYNPDMVGEYSTMVAAGAGYFYDEVLEYRVWCYIEDGAEDLAAGSDYYFAFAAYDEALEFKNKTKGAQIPLALVLQYEWIDEYEPGKFRHETGQRMAEWAADLLEGRAREDGSIDNFFKEKGLEKS